MGKKINDFNETLDSDGKGQISTERGGKNPEWGEKLNPNLVLHS